jgi:hypothetical protein
LTGREKAYREHQTLTAEDAEEGQEEKAFESEKLQLVNNPPKQKVAAEGNAQPLRSYRQIASPRLCFSSGPFASSALRAALLI